MGGVCRHHLVSGAREMLRSSWNFCRLPQAGGGGGAVGLEHRVRLQLGVRESFLPSKLSRAGAARRELPVQGVLGALNGQLHVEGDANDLQYCGGGRGGGAGLWDLQGPSCSETWPPTGNNVPRKQQEPPLITNCSVIFLLLPRRQQAEHLKQQQDAAGSFKAIDDFPSGFCTSFLHFPPSPSPCPPSPSTLFPPPPPPPSQPPCAWH